MKPLAKFTVVPTLPEPLAPLKELAENLWFSWHPEASTLFRQIDPELWKNSDNNPVYLLGRIDQNRLEDLAEDPGFLSELKRVHETFKEYITASGQNPLVKRCRGNCQVAYFSMEFGIAECLRTYSGGLGILAGDHLKSCSDLNYPIVGVSLLYQEGYFHQYLNADGWQQEEYPENDFANLPVQLIRDENDTPIMVEVKLQGKPVHIQIWKTMVGRVPLYFLDTNTELNPADMRYTTTRLYGGDREMRIRQEIVLGIGGVRALDRLGIKANVFHMNEGHSAFSALERIRSLQEKEKLSFDAARELVIATNAFTTHTPVPAGNDVFPSELMAQYFSDYAQSMGIAFKVLLAFGKENPWNDNEQFCMTVLALRLSSHTNGVSKLHSQVSQNMWKQIWPKNPTEDIPIEYITNGIHIPTFISRDMSRLFNRYLGPKWMEDPDSEKVWKRVDEISNSELWHTHERAREHLVTYTRQCLRKQAEKRGGSIRELEAATGALHPEVLTIGFARRFATYKRATILLRDKERLVKLLTDTKRPIQIIFAGKAHPADTKGKDLIKEITHFAREYNVQNRFIFLEDYSIKVSRHLVQGVDLWLNTPRRPLEACGTSGMKAIPNGTLNMSVLDGWWIEGYDPKYGWAIGRGETYEDKELQDDIESRDVYNLLETEVIPLFYDRGQDNTPNAWVNIMKNAMRNLCPVFNSHRMVQQYAHRFYVGCARRWNELTKDNMAGAHNLASWRQKLMTNWDSIKITNIQASDTVDLPINSELTVEADVRLAGLTPEDVDVAVYYGPLNLRYEFIERDIQPMEPIQESSKGNYRYRGKILCNKTGRFGLTIRIMPSNEKLETPYTTGLVIWAEGEIAAK
ncbi:MAG: alpha-glucan family phosphorylase [Pseudomonadota bacterium]